MTGKLLQTPAARSTEVLHLQRGEKVAEAVAAVLLVALYSIPVFASLQPRASVVALTDLKTALASSWCLAHRVNAYDLANIAAVFRSSGVPVPASWFAHAPVYPPLTLLLFLPLAGMSLVHAAFLLEAVWFAIVAVTLMALIRYAAEQFGIRMPLVVLLGLAFVSSPWLRAAAILGNLCIPAVCLAICAFLRRHAGSPWLPALALALSAALKPHIAIWVILAMLLLPDKDSRKVAVRCIAALASLALATVVFLGATHQLALQAHGYRAILTSEMSGNASMSPATHEVSALAIQITSLQSIPGFWHAPGGFESLLCDLLLVVLAGAALLLTLRAREERHALLSIAVWTAVGLCATYHREYDGLILLILLPWVFGNLIAGPQRWRAVVVAVLLIAASFGPALTTVDSLTSNGLQRTLGAFLLMRQAALADLSIVIVLLLLLWRDTMIVHPAPLN